MQQARGSMATLQQHDVLIIGTGAAGLSLALHLPPQLRVAMICKSELNEGSTYWAQGGMAAVLHTRDTCLLYTSPSPRD